MSKINKKTVHIDQKAVKNVKKSQKNVKNCNNSAKMCFTEEQICEIAGMFFRTEMQVARLTALLGLFFADKVDKYRLLKEYMSVDRFMLGFSSDCHDKIAKMTGAVENGDEE